MKKLIALAMLLSIVSVGAANATEKKPLTNADKLVRFEKTINNYVIKSATPADKCAGEIQRIKSVSEPTDNDLKIYKGCFVRSVN